VKSGGFSSRVERKLAVLGVRGHVHGVWRGGEEAEQWGRERECSQGEGKGSREWEEEKPSAQLPKYPSLLFFLFQAD